jgi:hypothetical protein
VLAVKPLKRSGHSDPGTSAYPPGDLDIPLASLRMKPVRLLRQDKEPFHTLQGKISGSMIVLSSSHARTVATGSINLFRRENLFLHPVRISDSMAATSLSIKIAPEMEDYIRARSTDMRIATTCEGPLIFSVKTSPPKPTDHVISVGARMVYISAVQAPYIKTIDASMLPRCALEKRTRN